jgi:hypothetical protein
MHLESTLEKAFSLWGGQAFAGATGYWYEQVTGDSGSGATFGSFKAKTVGAGPIIGYNRKLSEHVSLSTELKWLHEFDVDRRPEGDTVFMKILFIY